MTTLRSKNMSETCGHTWCDTHGCTWCDDTWNPVRLHPDNTCHPHHSTCECDDALQLTTEDHTAPTPATPPAHTATPTFTLYRFYDTHGALLYVGRTINIPARLTNHRRQKTWWPDVADIRLQQLDTHEALVEAERSAIINEHPMHNVVHNRAHSTSPAPTNNPPALRVPCMRCRRDIGPKGAFYMPYKERQRQHEAQQRRQAFIDSKGTSGLVFWTIGELREYGTVQARWQIHCLPCMSPCYDHPDDPDDTGCGGSYWFDRDRAATWPAIASWTAHLMEKDWLADTDWARVLTYIIGNNDPNAINV